MRPINDPEQWAATLRSFQTATHRAELLAGYGSQHELPGFEGGSVTLDVTAAVRGQCSLTFSDPALVPTVFSDPLAPYGQEIRVWRGLYDGAGNGQEISLGVFRIQDTSWVDEGSGVSITVNGFDRAQAVSEDTVVADGTSGAVQIAQGTDYITAMKGLISDAVQGAVFVGDGWREVHTTPLIVLTEGDDRWAAAQDMAAVLGYHLYWDGDGNCAMTFIPDVNQQPVEEFVEGDGGLLVSATTDWTREGTPNRVIYTGESTDNGQVWRGDAPDLDPNSPTYYNQQGFGKVNAFKQSDKITSQAMADAAAAGDLRKNKGTSKTINFGTIVNPALEPDDVVRVSRLLSGIVNEHHVIDSLTIPLDVTQSMTGVTRAVVVQ